MNYLYPSVYRFGYFIHTMML